MNLHSLRNQPLKLACLPISPPARKKGVIVREKLLICIGFLGAICWLSLSCFTSQGLLVNDRVFKTGVTGFTLFSKSPWARTGGLGIEPRVFWSRARRVTDYTIPQRLGQGLFDSRHFLLQPTKCNRESCAFFCAGHHPPIKLCWRPLRWFKSWVC